MKKTIIYGVMSLLVLSVVFAASVSRELPRRADPNGDVTIKLQISGADSSSVMALEEELPEGLSVQSWGITGAKEAKADITTREKDGRFAWEFTPSGTSATVEYVISVGSADVSFGTLVYFDSAGQGKVDAQTLRVAPITCGDGICEGGETSDNCEQDCPKPAPPPPAPAAPPTQEVVEEEPQKAPLTGIIIVAAIVVLGIIIYLVTKKKKVE